MDRRPLKYWSDAGFLSHSTEFSPIDFEFLAAPIQANELAVAVPEGRGPVHDICDLDSFLTVFQVDFGLVSWPRVVEPDLKRRDQGGRDRT